MRGPVSDAHREADQVEQSAKTADGCWKVVALAWIATLNPSTRSRLVRRTEDIGESRQLEAALPQLPLILG